LSSRYKMYDLSRIMHAKYMPVKIPFTWFTIIVTWFYIGRIPIASGTLGSIAFYPVYYYVIMTSQTVNEASSNLYLITIFLYIIGFLAVSKFQDVTNTFDHSYVVIDEIIGMSLTLAICFGWLYPLSYGFVDLWNLKPTDITFLLALIAFRFYDIKKPFFIRHVDRYYKNPFGVLLDDILAALFASGTIFIIFKAYDYFKH